MCGCGWREFTNSNRVAAALPHQHVLHATSPESANSTPQPIKAAMLAKWNSALESLRQAVQHPDAVRPFVPYGADFRPDELVDIPPFDVPAGIPAWMRRTDGWATCVGTAAAAKRRRI